VSDYGGIKYLSQQGCLSDLIIVNTSQGYIHKYENLKRKLQLLKVVLGYIQDSLHLYNYTIETQWGCLMSEVKPLPTHLALQSVHMS
jgi:hypothetical protein